MAEHLIIAEGDKDTKYMTLYSQLEALVGVQHGAVLHVGALTDKNGVGIAPHHRAIPDGGVLLQGHVTDDGGVVCHKAGSANGRDMSVKPFDHGQPP